MATTKMKAPKSETCWGSNFDFRNLNILLLSLPISLSRNPLTLALLSFNSCLWLLYSRTLHLGLLSSLLPEVGFLPSFFLFQVPLFTLSNTALSRLSRADWVLSFLLNSRAAASCPEKYTCKYHWCYHDLIISIWKKYFLHLGPSVQKPVVPCKYFDQREKAKSFLQTLLV